MRIYSKIEQYIWYQNLISAMMRILRCDIKRNLSSRKKNKTWRRRGNPDKIPTSKETCRQRKRIKDYENHNKEGKKRSQKKTEQNQSIGKAKWKKGMHYFWFITWFYHSYIICITYLSCCRFPFLLLYLIILLLLSLFIMLWVEIKKTSRSYIRC